MALSNALITAISLVAGLATAQMPPAVIHNTGFNSSFILTPAQIESAQLSPALVESLQNVINFERTQLAFGGPHEDDFYTLPPLVNETGHFQPGQILKIQAFTDPTAYAIPPNTAISRILYTTTNFNGTVIPASGAILWPYAARKVGGDGAHATHRGRNNGTSHGPLKAPVVVWTHGTSGFFASQSPSSHRGLWYDNGAPFALAQAGYAVFAPDYAGLGVHTSWDGSRIPHQYHASPATARDALYGLRAVRAAFPDRLDDRFIVFGHSQGGGVAWAAAEVLATERDRFADLIQGYRGSIPASPTTKVLSGPPGFILPTLAQMLDSVFPEFDASDWLTPLGVARQRLAIEVEAGTVAYQYLFMAGNESDVIRPDWNTSWYGRVFSSLGDASRRDFLGPLLVVQGSEDIYVPYATTVESVEATSRLFPGRDIELLVAGGVAHTPVLSATRQFWLEWIQDRFEGKPLVARGSFRTDLESFMPINQYLRTGNSFPLWAGLPELGYELPLSF